MNSRRRIASSMKLARHAEQRRALTVMIGYSAKHLHYVGSFNQGALRVHPTKARRGKCSVKAPKVKPRYKRRFRESRSDFSLGLASQSLARLCRAAQVKRFGAQNDEVCGKNKLCSVNWLRHELTAEPS